MYQSNSGGARRVLGTGVMVGAIQLGIGAVFLATFAGGEIVRVIDHTINAKQWIYMPPLPHPLRSHPVHNKVPDHNPLTGPKPAIDGLATGPTELTLGPLAPIGPLTGDGRGFLSDWTPPRTPPALPPVAARALGNPGLWITPDDYPSRALRESWTGVTRLHLVIGSDGRVATCAVTASSGHPELDTVACAKVAERARFTPARDASGAQTDGSYDSAIRWQVQDISGD